MSLAYVDVNVIMRFLLDEPQDMAEQATAVFSAAERGEIDLFVDEIAIAEAVWLLKSYYHFNPNNIARVLSEFLLNEWLQTDNKAALLKALKIFSEKNIDFTDTLMAVHMEWSDVEEIYSFDSHFDRLSWIHRLEPGKSRS